nr:histidine kinase [Tissierella sp.]
MRQFIEKLFIVILGLYASYIFYPQNDLVLFFLVSIILSLLLDLINPTRVRVFIYICFIGLCFFNKLFIPYLPLILYNMYIDFGIYSLSSFLLFFRDPNLVTIFAAFISLYLTITRDSFNRFTEDNKIVRDELKEDAIYLRKYNEQLKIDREKNIHIAILTERNRIAREMHDSIGHSISSSILQVEALKIVSNTSLDSLDLLQNTLSTGMDDIRRSIHNLYSDSLDLKKRIQTLCEEAISLDIDLDYRLEETLSYDFKFDILSIVRESITNCIKHSDGDKLSIKILTQPQFYSITIRDNGRSFIEKGSSSSQGMGLILMEEIARKYDGFINYEFREGFKIYITLMKG